MAAKRSGPGKLGYLAHSITRAHFCSTLCPRNTGCCIKSYECHVMSCIGIADGAGAMWYHATEKLRMPGTDIAYGVPGHVADLVTGGQSPVIILCTYSALQEPTQAAMPGTDRAYALQIAGNRILALPPGSASLAAYDSATVSPVLI